jgi:pimeloyl-ACP methyl ester carboxylesterase
MKKMCQTKLGAIEYRLFENDQKGETVLILHGGHCHCETTVEGELMPRFFLHNGYQVLVPSRPGYGHTPLSTGETAESFSDALIDLLDQLGIQQVHVVGISTGSRTALQLASRYRDRVDKLILQCALTKDGLEPNNMKLEKIIYGTRLEKYMWKMVRIFLQKIAPNAALKLILFKLSTLHPKVVLEGMTDVQKKAMIAYVSTLRSRQGFIHDLTHVRGDLKQVEAPTLIIHSKYDKANDFSHAEYAKNNIRNSILYTTEAESHFIWFSEHYWKVEQEMLRFLQHQKVSELSQ